MDQENREAPIFDLDREYKEQVRPLVDQIYKICEKIGMPMHIIFNTLSNDEGLKFKASRVGRPMEEGEDWAPLQFIKFVRIMENQPVSMEELVGTMVRNRQEAEQLGDGPSDKVH